MPVELRDERPEDAMIKSMKRLFKDRRGNVLAIVGASIPLVVGAAGLATDTIQWVTWKRELQRAADSAALAGVYAKAQDSAVSANAAVTRDLSKHQTTGINLSSGYPIITYPNQTGWTNPVRVTLRVQKRLGFSSLFISSAPLITATATAAMVDDGKYCLVALEDGTTAGISIQGSATANLRCGVISNSINVDESIDVTGNAYTLNAAPVAGSGGLPTASLQSHGASNIQPYHVAMQDPYKNSDGTEKYDTSIPPSVPCTNFTDSSKTNADGTKKPGCYNNWTNSNSVVNLSPGVYYLNNTSIDLQGNRGLAGNGVTIILTGTNPGTISLNGNANVNLTAPTDATCGTNLNNTNSCNYKKMLFIQASNASNANTNLINGNSGQRLDGAIYFPKGDITFSGSSAAMTECAMIVGLRVHFQGNTNIQNDTRTCNADSSVKAQAVRLVG